MENFLVSLRAVFPMFTIMSIGYVVRRTGMLDELSLKKMNAVCFKIFMTAMLFQNIYNLEIKSVFNLPIIILVVAGIAVMVVFSYRMVMRLEPENRRRGVLIQALYRSNYVVLGFPIVSAVYGLEGLALPSLLISITIPLYNILAVLILSYFNGETPSIRKMARDVVLNPYILAAIVGFSFLFLGIRLPEMVESVVADMANVASPLAILILGASFRFENIRIYAKYLVLCCSFRLVLFPGIWIGLAILLGFRGVELLTLVAIFATPTAIASHVMAQQFDGDADLAGVLVVISTAVSLITLFLWVFGLKSFGLLPV